MKVVIVGASYTGIQLAKTLADEKSDVVLIDNSPEKVRLARNKIDCTVIQAAGNDLQVLERDAGISSAVAMVEKADMEGFSTSLRHSAFQVASIVSTTGFMTSDYACWQPAAQMFLFLLFFVGGCSGSTAGGIKVIRWAVLGKQLRNELRRITHPREVTTIRINGYSGRDEIVPLVAAFVTLYALLVFATAVAGAFAGLGLVEAVSCALSMVGNIGPAFGSFGPTANYGAIPCALKWWYSFAMIAGRLEIFTMLILFGRIVALLARPSKAL